MTLSTGISPQLYLLVAALAEDLNGKGGEASWQERRWCFKAQGTLYKRDSQ